MGLAAQPPSYPEGKHRNVEGLPTSAAPCSTAVEGGWGGLVAGEIEKGNKEQK